MRYEDGHIRIFLIGRFGSPARPLCRPWHGLNLDSIPITAW
jgi:hypothetical protein